MIEDEIVNQFTKKEDILNIFNLIKSRKIIKTKHFYDRLIFRDLEEELVDKTFPKFEKIKLIDKRKHKNDFGYDLHYKLSRSRTLKLCFIPIDDKSLLINVILNHRRWQNSIKTLGRFRQSGADRNHSKRNWLFQFLSF